LKLKCHNFDDKLLSSVAFNFKLRRYSEVEEEEAAVRAEGNASPGPFWSPSVVSGFNTVKSGLCTVSMLVLGAAFRETVSAALSRAMQIGPIKPTLTAPYTCTKLFNLKYDEAPSNLAGNFNLCRYITARTTSWWPTG
jgi:hypothetical protein